MSGRIQTSRQNVEATPARGAVRAAQAEYDEAIAAHRAAEGSEHVPRIVAANEKIAEALAAEKEISIKNFFRGLLEELGD